MQSVVVGRPQDDMPIGNFVLSYANSTDDVKLPPIEELPEHPAWDDNTGFDGFFEELNTEYLNEHVGEEPALIANDTDIDRYVLTLTQGFNPDVYEGQMYWTLNNISFYLPKNPLIYTAVEESRLLGWPLPNDKPLKGTVDLPHKNPVSWDLLDSMNPEPNRVTISLDHLRRPPSSD